MCGRVHASARRAEPASKSLKGSHCTGHAFAISDAALAAHFNLQDCLAEILIVHDRHIAELKTPSFVEPQPGSCSCTGVESGFFQSQLATKQFTATTEVRLGYGHQGTNQIRTIAVELGHRDSAECRVKETSFRYYGPAERASNSGDSPHL